MKKLKVALFADVMQDNLDGVTRTLANVFSHIPEEIDIRFFTALPPSYSREKVIGVRKTPMPGYREYPLCLPFFSSRLKKELQKFNPDVVHFIAPTLLGWYAAIYGKLRKKYVVASYHTDFLSYQEYYLRMSKMVAKLLRSLAVLYGRTLYNLCNIVLVPSVTTRSFLIDNGVRRHKVKLWQRGLDAKVFSPDLKNAYFKTHFGVSRSKRVILFVSRLVEEKNLTTLIEIYNRLHKHPELQFAVAGSGPAEKKLHDNMPDCIFTGKLDNTELGEVYASSFLFLFPSTTETFGNVVLEAMGSGVPPIISDLGGAQDLVGDGVSGYVCRAFDVDHYVERIIFLLEHPDVYQRMAENAFQSSLTMRWETIRAQLFEMYNGCGGVYPRSK